MDCKFKTGDYAFNKMTGEKVIVDHYILDDAQYKRLCDIRYFHSDGSDSYGHEEVFFTEIEYKQLLRRRKLQDLLS